MAFPTIGPPRECQFEGSRGQAATMTSMRVHFLHRHVQDTVVILDGGNLHHPRCPRYEMLLPWKDLNGRHITTTRCTKGAEQKRRQLTEEYMRESADITFQAYGRPINIVTPFKYLGWVMMASDEYCPPVVGNLQKAQKSWDQLTRIL